MIKDYKGEMPKNVTTPEKAKAKKPFYKDWKFWVLTGLMTLFGACSIYGLVLGSQYVKAIERASHIIADAQSGQVQSESVKKLKQSAFIEGNVVRSLKVSSLSWVYDAQWSRFLAYNAVPDAIFPANGDTWPDLICADYLGVPFNYLFIASRDDIIGMTSGGNGALSIKDTDYSSVSDFVSAKGDMLVYYRATAGSSAYDDAYQEGYSEGHSDGFEEGYSDGSDAINVNQAFRVVMPVGNDSVQYHSYIDGVDDQQGQIVGGSTSPNYREFIRNRNQVLRVDLTLPSGYRAFWSYTPAFTSSFPVSDNLSLQESWAVDGVVYLPTWVSSVQLWVGVTSAQVPDLTTQSVSVAFDVAHWGDIKVGAYHQGYQQGYVDGQQDPTAYQTGYDAGYEDGHDAGEIAGYNRGVGDGTSGSQSLAHMFRVAFQLPFDQLYAYLNFNLLGINFASLFTALITVSLGIIVIKKVL